MATEELERVREPIYHIRVRGTLDAKWAGWFDGFVMAARDDGETLLSGAADPAALHGVLAQIQRLGLPLLLVSRAGCPCTSKNCPRHGRCGECVAYHGEKGKLPFCFRARTRWDKQCAALTGRR